MPPSGNGTVEPNKQHRNSLTCWQDEPKLSPLAADANSLELCPLPRHVPLLGEPVRRQRAAAGGRLCGGGLGILSGRSAPAHTGGGPGRSPWTRSTGGPGRLWPRSAGWGRTAGVAVKGGGGEESTPRPHPRAGGPPAPKGCLQTQNCTERLLPAHEPAPDTPGTWRPRLRPGPALLSHLPSVLRLPGPHLLSLRQTSLCVPASGGQTCRLGQELPDPPPSQAGGGGAARTAGLLAPGWWTQASGKRDVWPDDGNSPACLGRHQ